MKKFSLVLPIMLMTMFLLVACGGSNNEDTAGSENSENVETNENVENNAEAEANTGEVKEIE